MMSQIMQWRSLGFTGLMIIAMAGCTRSIDVIPHPLDRQEAAAQSIADEQRVPFIIDTFRLSLNGAPQNPSPDLERRILNSVQETRLFSTLVPSGEAPVSLDRNSVNARIVFDETIDPHAGQTALKGFIIGASMFLLSPVIELDYDYSARATLDLERWDGQVYHYEARSSGTAHYNLFGATPIMIDELKGQVTEACLAELMNHLILDTHLYVASSTPLTNPTTRTITARPRKPQVSEGASTIIPISRAPTP